MKPSGITRGKPSTSPLRNTIPFIIIALILMPWSARNTAAFSPQQTDDHEIAAAHVAYLNMKNEGSQVTAPVGEVIPSRAYFQAWSQPACPTCVSQIVVGIGADAQTCIFDGMPGEYPGVTRLATFNLTAPASGGILDIRYRMTQALSCSQAMTEYEAGATNSYEILGRLTVATPGEYSMVLTSLSLNGRGDTIHVNVGTAVSANTIFRIWSPSWCLNCFDQMVIGIDDTAQFCAYHGKPGGYPGYAGNITQNLTVPSTPGTYTIRYRLEMQYNCDDAKAIFNSVPIDQTTQIGTLVVLNAASNPLYTSNLNLNNTGKTATIQPGRAFSGSMDYQIWNPASCQYCINQVVIGVGHDAQTCLYTGIPAQFPGVTNNGTFSLTSPGQVGVYDVRMKHTLEINCANAMANYENGPYEDTEKIGTLVVPLKDLYLPALHLYPGGN